MEREPGTTLPVTRAFGGFFVAFRLSDSTSATKAHGSRGNGAARSCTGSILCAREVFRRARFEQLVAGKTLSHHDALLLFRAVTTMAAGAHFAGGT